MICTRKKLVQVLLFTLIGLCLYLYLIDTSSAMHYLKNNQLFVASINGNAKDAGGRYKIVQQIRGTNNKADAENITYRKILFWGDWHGGKWEAGFGPASAEGLRKAGCPTWQCHFSYDKSSITTADVVVVRLAYFWELAKHKYQRPETQRWMLVDIEPPGGPQGTAAIRVNDRLINWTLNYHSNSDIQGGVYGYFKPLDNNTLQFQVNFIHGYPDTMKRNQEALDKNSSLEEIIGPAWTTYVKKPKIAAWMISNCWGRSGRKDYVDELKRYMSIDIYGACTGKWCLNKGKNRAKCWNQVLGWQYSFYLAFENNLCDEYITEKTFLSFQYNVVPVVYGASDYTQYLPPNSYIDARDYHPKDLAQLLQRLHNDPVALGRYHIWRGYWQVIFGGSFCHLCHSLHTNFSYHRYVNINQWHWDNGKCNNPPYKLFNNEHHPDACWQFIRTNSSCFSP